MKTQVAATYVGGQFKPDEKLSLAEDTRVTLTIESIEEDRWEDDDYVPTPEEARAAFEHLQTFLKKHPIHGGGKKFARDELYERR